MNIDKTILFFVFVLLIGNANGEESIGSNTSPLITSTTTANDCSIEHQKFNSDIMRFGRISAVSKAFEQCVDDNVRNNYKKCIGDPFFHSPVSAQIQKVIDISRSTNNIHIFCTGGSGNASASIGEYAHPSDEVFSWGGWFSSAYNQLERRVCNLDADERPATHNCRWADYPWPYNQAAGIVWHEAMHTHGYTHGANEQVPAKTLCGYNDDSSWNFQVNTMPYILANCITQVIDKSALNCGNIGSCPSPNQLKLIESYDGTDCVCVADPAHNGFGIITLKENKLTDVAIHPDGEWIGGWHYGPSNVISATGDFNGDDITDLVITSSWGIGIISFVGNRWIPLVVKPKGTRFGEWNYNTNHEIGSVGDFNGDGKDDLVVRSGWGIGILTLNRDTLTHLMLKPKGTRFGEWNYNTNHEVGPVGDFNGDGKDDLVVRSGWGIGILTLNRDTLTHLMLKPKGTRFGGWNYNTNHEVGSVGDFNGDGKDDLVVRSGWGIGILTLNRDTLTHLMVKPKGTRFGEWNYNTNHEVGSVGDFNGDGKDDLVFRSGWGLGVLQLAGTTLRHIDMKPYNKLFGSWLLQPNDLVIGVDNFYTGGKKSIILQKKP